MANDNPNTPTTTEAMVISLRNNQKYINKNGVGLAVTYLNDAADRLESLQTENKRLKQESDAMWSGLAYEHLNN